MRLDWANSRRSLVIRGLAVIPGTRAEARVYRRNVSSTFRAAARSTISCLVSNASMMARNAPHPPGHALDVRELMLVVLWRGARIAVRQDTPALCFSQKLLANFTLQGIETFGLCMPKLDAMSAQGLTRTPGRV